MLLPLPLLLWLLLLLSSFQSPSHIIYFIWLLISLSLLLSPSSFILSTTKQSVHRCRHFIMKWNAFFAIDLPLKCTKTNLIQFCRVHVAIYLTLMNRITFLYQVEISQRLCSTQHNKTGRILLSATSPFAVCEKSSQHTNCGRLVSTRKRKMRSALLSSISFR